MTGEQPTMADVLAAKFAVETDRLGTVKIWATPTEVEAALSAAGFGPVREAQADPSSAVRFVLGERERELLELKGPCSFRDCRLHYAHYGPCDTSRKDAQ